MFKIHAAVTQEYILGPGDVLSITDLNGDDEEKGATATVPILPDGTAMVRYCGLVNAAGMTLREINELVNERSRKWFKDPQIVINLTKQRPTQVYLLGEVTKPGLYSPKTGDGGGSDTPEHASAAAPEPFNLTMALQAAGGLKDSADVRHIHITRLAPKKVFDVDLWKLMLDGDISEDIMLQPGDVVFVPKGGNEFDREVFGTLANADGMKVRVIGAVKSPGLLKMDTDDDVLSVITKAGGLQSYAKTNEAWLTRTNHDGTVTTEKINLKKAITNPLAAGRTKVRAGDIIVVRRSVGKSAAMVAGKMANTMSTSLLMTVMMMRLRNTMATTTVTK